MMCVSPRWHGQLLLPWTSPPPPPLLLLLPSRSSRVYAKSLNLARLRQISKLSIWSPVTWSLADILQQVSKGRHVSSVLPHELASAPHFEALAVLHSSRSNQMATQLPGHNEAVAVPTQCISLHVLLIHLAMHVFVCRLQQ